MFPNTYKGTVDHFVKTYEQIWFQFFCKGTTPALVANVGEPSVLSTCYGFCQQVAKRIVGADRKTKLRLVTEACSIFKTRKKKNHTTAICKCGTTEVRAPPLPTCCAVCFGIQTLVEETAYRHNRADPLSLQAAGIFKTWNILPKGLNTAASRNPKKSSTAHAAPQRDAG